MATLWLFIVGVLSLVFFEPLKTAYIHNDPSLLWRFVTLFTHMVSHGNWEHLIGNFSFGAPFMIYLEHKLKDTKKFVRLFFAIGFCSLVFQCIFNLFTPFQSAGLIGSSGAIFGLVGAALMLYDGPRPLMAVAKSLAIFYLYSQFQLALASLYWPMGVAYAAHFGGLVAGIAFSLHHRRHLRHRLKSPASRTQK